MSTSSPPVHTEGFDEFGDAVDILADWVRLIDRGQCLVTRFPGVAPEHIIELGEAQNEVLIVELLLHLGVSAFLSVLPKMVPYKPHLFVARMPEMEHGTFDLVVMSSLGAAPLLFVQWVYDGDGDYIGATSEMILDDIVSFFEEWMDHEEMFVWGRPTQPLGRP